MISSFLSAAEIVKYYYWWIENPSPFVMLVFMTNPAFHPSLWSWSLFCQHWQWEFYEEKVKMDRSWLITFMFIAVSVDQTNTQQNNVSIARKSRVCQTPTGHFYHNEFQPTLLPSILETGFVHLMPYWGVIIKDFFS